MFNVTRTLDSSPVCFPNVTPSLLHCLLNLFTFNSLKIIVLQRMVLVISCQPYHCVIYDAYKTNKTHIPTRLLNNKKREGKTIDHGKHPGLILLSHDFLPVRTKIVCILSFGCFVLALFVFFLFLSELVKQWGGTSICCLNNVLTNPEPKCQVETE